MINHEMALQAAYEEVLTLAFRAEASVLAHPNGPYTHNRRAEAQALRRVARALVEARMVDEVRR